MTTVEPSDSSIPDTSEPAVRARRGRGNDTSQLIVISWRDVPAQVNAQRGRERAQVILSAKFQRSIDRAKRKAKIYTAQEDIAQWNRLSRPCGDDLAAEAQAEADKLEETYSVDHLGRLGFWGGFEEHNRRPDEVLYDDGEDELETAEDDDPAGAGTDESSDWGTWSNKTNPARAQASPETSADVTSSEVSAS
jgi:hypothetical protein